MIELFQESMILYVSIELILFLNNLYNYSIIYMA